MSISIARAPAAATFAIQGQASDLKTSLLGKPEEDCLQRPIKTDDESSK